jgi:hypothetical protein
MSITRKIAEGIRRFFQSVLPENAKQDMEKESRKWFIKCSNCKFEKSVWESGGIRWKAAGTPRKMMLCSNCGQLTLHVIYKKDGTAGQ